MLVSVGRPAMIVLASNLKNDLPTRSFRKQMIFDI